MLFAIVYALIIQEIDCWDLFKQINWPSIKMFWFLSLITCKGPRWALCRDRLGNGWVKAPSEYRGDVLRDMLLTRRLLSWSWFYLEIRSYILAVILEEDVSKWFFPVPLPMIQFVFKGLINYSSLHIVYAAEFDLTMSRKTNLKNEIEVAKTTWKSSFVGNERK